MVEAISKSRQLAEVAFSKVQSQFIARHRAIEEADSIKLERDEKTRRLRAARLEQAQRDTALAVGLQKHATSNRRISPSGQTAQNMSNNAK